MAFSEHTKRVDLRDYFGVLARRWWLVVVPIVVGALVAFVATLPRFRKPIYQATSRLEMEFPQPLSRRLQDIVAQPTGRDQFDRLSSMVRSSEFLRHVIRTTGLANDPLARQWAARRRSKYPSLNEDDLVELYLMKYLRGTLSAEAKRKEPNVFTVTVVDHYPRRALELCNAITDGVVTASKSLILEQMKATQDFALEQVQNYKNQLAEAEGRLEAYQNGGHLSNIEGGLVKAANLSSAEALERNAQVQVDDYREKRLRLARDLSNRGEDSEKWLQMMRPSQLEEAEKQHASLVIELAQSEIQDLAATVGMTSGTTMSLSVQVANKRREIEDEYSRLLSGPAGQALAADRRKAVIELMLTDLDLDAAEARRSYISREIADYRRRASQIPGLEMQARRVAQEVETIRNMFNTFMDQVIAAQVAQSFEAQKVGGRLKVLEPAQLPLEPVNSNRYIIMSIAALGGLCLGLMLVFVVEHHDTTIRDGSELPLPIRDRLIGSMPLIRDRLRKERELKRAGAGRPVTVFDYYRDEAASSFEFRRLVLELAGPKGQLAKTIMVTSSERGEGKTTTSSLLALTIARHRKLRTVLLDLDMRKPSIHRHFGLARYSPGAAEALVEHRLSQELIHPTSEPCLFILPAGSFRSLSPETLTPESVRWLLDELLQWFDQVIVDAPPNLAVPDPLVIGKAVDSVLFVVKSGKTSQRVFARGYDLQVRARENVAGVFVNNIRNTMPHYYNYEYYGYAAEEPQQPAKPKNAKPRPKLVPGDRA